MRWVAWMTALICGSVLWAQSQVVNLRYELWWDERSFWYGQRLEPTTPSNAKLPPLSEPRFFIGKFVDGKRLFVLAMKDGHTPIPMAITT